jgi:hypothetical protein
MSASLAALEKAPDRPGLVQGQNQTQRLNGASLSANRNPAKASGELRHQERIEALLRSSWDSPPSCEKTGTQRGAQT